MEIIIFLILFSLLGWVEIIWKPRLDFTEDYVFIWYGGDKKRNFIRFTKIWKNYDK